MKTVTFFFTLLLFSMASYSESRIAIINDEKTSINLIALSEVYQDTEKTNTFADITKLSSEGYFTPFNESFIQLGPPNGNVWIKTELSFKQSTSNHSYLYIKAPQINEVDIYFPQTTQEKLAYSLGKNKPYNSKQIHHPEYLIPIPNTTHNTVIIYIKLTSNSALTAQIFAVDSTEIIKISLKSLLSTGLFTGIIFIFLIGGILFFIYTRHSMYIIYSVFLCCVLIIHLSHHGLINYFLSHDDLVKEKPISLFFLFYLSSLAFFSRHYLDTHIYFPKIDKTLLLIGCLNLMFSLILSIYPDNFANAFFLANILITSTMLIGFSLYTFIKKAPYSGYYLSSRIIAFLGLYTWVMSAYGVYPSPFFYQWGLTIIMFIEASLYFSGMIKRLTHFSHSPINNSNTLPISITETQAILIDAGERMKRQVNVLDNYITFWQSAQLKDNEKNLTLEAILASNNLKLLIKNLTLLTNKKPKQETPILLDKIIHDALEGFNSIDQDNTDLSLTSKGTKNIEVLKNAPLFQQIIINLAQECKHLNDQLTTIHVAHTEHTKLGIKTLDITCEPIPKRSKNDLSSFNLGIGLIKELIEYLEGTINITQDNTLSISIPVQTRLQFLPYDTLEAEPAQIFVIGHESILVQRTIRSLQIWPNNVVQIKNISELLTEVKTLQNENTINLVLMFENEGYIPNLALKQIREKLHAGDQCILVTENDKMSRNYALTLGFDDLFSNTNVEQQLRESLERFTLKGLRIKNASSRTAKK